MMRTLPSPKRNCGPAAEGEPQLPPPHDSLPTSQLPPDANSGKSFSRESGYSPSPQRPVPPVPPMTTGSSQYQTPAEAARALMAFSPKNTVFDSPSAMEATVETFPQFEP